MRFAIAPRLLFTGLFLLLSSYVAATSLQGGFLIYGKVSLPDGRPASRVIVKVNGTSGLERQTQTDDQGSYSFPFVPGGRYTLKATHPLEASLASDAVEADTSRTVGNRMLVHINMRPPAAAVAHPGSRKKPVVISVVEAAQRVPKEARKAYEEGLKYRNNRRYDQALRSFDRAVELYPDYFQALTARGDVRIVDGKIDEAAIDFERALKLDAEHQPALRGIGFCHLERGSYNEAARYLVRALEVDPNDANSHLFLGMTLIQLRQNQLAKEAFKQALKFDSQGAAIAAAHLHLADLYSRDQNYRAAADELHVYLQARPDVPNKERLRSMEAEFRTRAKNQTKP